MYYQTFNTKDGVDLALYVPGYTRDDIEVTRQGNYIIVSGSTESQFAADAEFSYKFKLTDRASKVDPELKDGVLILHIKNNLEALGTQKLKIR